MNRHFNILYWDDQKYQTKFLPYEKHKDFYDAELNAMNVAHFLQALPSDTLDFIYEEIAGHITTLFGKNEFFLSDGTVITSFDGIKKFLRDHIRITLANLSEVNEDET